MTKDNSCKHKDLFCICERNKYAEHVNDFIVKSNILSVIKWTSNRELGDEKKILVNIMSSLKTKQKESKDGL